ncbi:MAG: dicarboxylate/amino acid:cation symporter [Planctomycetaceae bacterium]|nr:dicarboxylate/amino acid:cation symporter [Planctomycetaceae bacterium]MBT6156395.1 dicarboxylate/amino acid:cation symporter [Planctomycetaceae bacterium]MBT6487991.1 dicarboxylate/amino acid:cation symporter [Planctomycetaceae bacterium]MBT6495450.1 dicarboxylate/amino acid:cation symporter [Planctomycetaceae bacterium]
MATDTEKSALGAKNGNGKHSSLTLWIVAAIVAATLFALIGGSIAQKTAAQRDAIAAGIPAEQLTDEQQLTTAQVVFNTMLEAIDLGGVIFLSLLQMVVVPLVMASVMSGILGMGDVRKLGRPGGVAILYYMTTTVLAVATGLIVVNIIDPGLMIDPETIASAQEEGEHQVDKAKAAIESKTGEAAEPPTMGMILKNLTLMLFTKNLLGSMVDVNLLPLIVFSIIFAGMLTTMGQRSETMATLIVSINDALMNFIMLLMKVAPIGIFCLVTARFGMAQMEGQFLDLLETLAGYMATVLIGLGIHAFITLPAILYLMTRRNPYRFMGRMSQALLTAFSTSSSTATLPVTMECAETNANVSKRATEFVLPLGATINMDGTALYEAAAAVFIAQAYTVVNPEYTLTFAEQMVIAVTATLAAIGAAGIPEAGLVTMLIVLNAVNLPLELIGLILPVDWLLDRFRTTVNVFGDSAGTAIVDPWFDTSEPGPVADAPPAATKTVSASS